MDSKLLKIIKVLILVLMILIIAIISILLLKQKTINNEDRVATPATQIDAVEINRNIEKVSSRSDYYIAKNCVNTFYINYSQIYTTEEDNLILDEDALESNEEIKKQNIQIVYDTLDEEYIKYNNITVDNLESKLQKINKVTVNIIDMYVCSKNDKIKVYFVYGNLIDVSKSKSTEISLMLKVDTRNRTFKVLLQDYVEKNYKQIEIGEEIDIKIPDAIENKTYNVYKYENVKDEIYINDIFTTCKMELLYNVEDIYNKFSDEYKESRFKTVEELKEYVKNNRKNITIMKLSKYQKNVYNEYTEYVCIDSNNKYYIINEKGPLNYSITLDIYTINTPEFKSKYDSSDNINKVGLNLEKIKQAINEKDYRYVYNKLNNEFKQNNYSDYNVFEKYLKNNLFEDNKFNYENVEENQSIYVANIIVNDRLNEESGSKKMSIIMKLNENYEYEISFSFE